MTKSKYKSQRYLQKERMCYLMLSPQIIGFLVFSIIPMIWAISKSWTFYNLIETRFVGWENFKPLLSDTSYWNSLLTTLKFAIMKIPIEIPLALILAVLLSRKIKAAGLFRAVYYLPHVISTALVALVFSNLFNYFGVFNAVLQKLGIIDLPIDWFSSTTTAI